LSGFEGFFTLATPADLLEKLKHDYSRVCQDHLDPYAAFDFFVTAEHLLDWKYPDSGGRVAVRARKDLRTRVPLLRVTSHLANGAKHFRATSTRHKSVEDVRRHEGIFYPAIFEPAIFDTPRLLVELTGEDADALGAEIWVRDLAEQVLHYWEANIAAQ
jgi:hypothetical protein